MRATCAHSDRLLTRRRARRERDYCTRMMAALVASLAVVTALFRIPVERREVKVGWEGASSSERVEFSTDRSVQAIQSGGTITTSSGTPSPQPAVLPAEGEGETVADDAPVQSTVRPMQALETVYEFAQDPPAIRGGLGAYYINIEYPPEAVEREIEGRLVLRFVVGTDGRARDIDVMQPLHPLCDSAAVRALRQTTFVPGRQNGKRVAVRMKLPVRFRLVGPGRLDSETS